MTSRGLAGLWHSRAKRSHVDAPRVTTTSRVKFELSIEVDEGPGGVHEAVVQPFGIRTFGDSLDDAIQQVFGAVESYVESLIEHNELVSEFQRLGVQYSIERVHTREWWQPSIELVDDKEDRRHHGLKGSGRALVPA